MPINERRSLWRRLRPYFTVFDVPLMIIIMMLLSVGLVTLYSAGIGIPGKVEDQLRNICLAFMVMWVVANVSPQLMMRFAVPVYVVSTLSQRTQPPCSASVSRSRCCSATSRSISSDRVTTSWWLCSATRRRLTALPPRR